MNIIVKVDKEIDIKTLKVSAGVRYWEDSKVNGVDDEQGDLMPCRKGDYWCPEIDIETGKILNWEKGKEANISYKVCDDGTYILCDNKGKNIVTSTNEYVPNALCPKNCGYGDYIAMDITGDGIILDWEPKFGDFFLKSSTRVEI